MKRPDWSSFERILAAALLVLVLGGCAEGPDRLDTVYRILIEGCTGSEIQRATAVAVGPETLVTVAHSFEGAKTITVVDSDDRDVAVQLVYLDPAKDVAVLRPAGPVERVLALEDPEENGPVSIITFADGEGPAAKRAEILELVEATLDGEGRRSAIRLEAAVEPGDSGAAVVDGDDRMVGMVFAKARGDDIGWAISSVEIATVMDLLDADRPEAIAATC